MPPLSKQIEHAYNKLLPFMTEGATAPPPAVSTILVTLAQWHIRAEMLEKEIEDAHRLIDVEEGLQAQNAGKECGSWAAELARLGVAVDGFENVVPFPSRRRAR